MHNLSGPLNLNNNEIRNMLLHLLGAAPGSPQQGRVWLNTSDGYVYYFNGTANQQICTYAQLLATRLDQLAAPTADLNINNRKLINVADPTQPQDAATMAYVDARVNGLKWKDGVRVATTGNISLTGLFTVDGVSVAADDRVAVMYQTDGTKNGLYLAKSGAWVRTSDANTGAKVLNMTFFVSEGTGNGNKIFSMNTDGPITLDSTVLVFGQIGSAISYVAGVGITISGSTIGIDTTVVARKAVAQIGNGSSTSITVNHNLNTKAITVGLRKVSTDEHWIPDVVSTTVNSATLSFTTAPATNEFEVIITG